MKIIQPYENLKRIYSKSVMPWIVVFIVITIGSIAAAVLQILYTRNYNILFFLLLPTVFSVVWLTRRNTAKKSLSHFSESGLARLNNEIDTAEKTEGFGVTSEALVAVQNQLFALPINDVVWIYPHVTTGKIMFIPVANSYDIVVVDRNKKRYYLKGKLQKTDQAFILNFLQNKLFCVREGVFFGFTEENQNLFFQDFDRMVAVSDGYEML